MTHDGWREYPLGAFMTRLTRKNSELNDNVLTISAQHGMVSQEEFFNKRVASNNLSNYFLLERGEFVYSKSRTKDCPLGAIKRLDAHHKGVVSPLYICFALTDLTVATSDYITHLFESGTLDGQLRLIAKEGGRAHGLLNVKPSEFFKVVADLPPLPEQRRIAAILSSVDEAIEKTQAVIDQMQVVKRGLMQELLTRGLPGRHTRFKRTEIGEIPETWDLVSLADCGARVTSGSRGWAKYYSNGGALFLRITNLARNTIRLQLDSIRRVTLPDGSAEGRRTRVQAGDLVISITADLGLIGIIPADVGEAYVNQHLALVRLLDCELSPEFAGYFLATATSRNRFDRLNDSGAKAGLNLPTIMKLTVPRPPRDEQDAIVQVLAATEDRLATEARKLAGLAATKRALMSVLLTGELRVAPCTDAT